MRVFLSYASEDRVPAERIALAIEELGHEVFLDRGSLPEGGEYHRRIRSEVFSSDGLVFLISRASMAKGCYALTELRYARKRWPRPEGRVLPVVLDDFDVGEVPPYLRQLTPVRPEGDEAAEVADAVRLLAAERVESPLVGTYASEWRLGDQVFEGRALLQTAGDGLRLTLSDAGENTYVADFRPIDKDRFLVSWQDIDHPESRGIWHAQVSEDGQVIQGPWVTDHGLSSGFWILRRTQE